MFINACRKGRYWLVEVQSSSTYSCRSVSNLFLQFLVLRSIDIINKPDSQGCTGLYRAAETGHDRVVRTLINRHHASVGFELTRFFSSGCFPFISVLLARVLVRSTLGHKFDMSRTSNPLYILGIVRWIWRMNSGGLLS